MSFRPDILLEIKFNMKDPNKTVIETNAKPEVVEELLVDWVQMQMGQGSDGSKAEDREVYTIRIGLRLEDDCFGTESDTNNKGLTCGIIMDVIRLLNLPGNVDKMVRGFTEETDGKETG